MAAPCLRALPSPPAGRRWTSSPFTTCRAHRHQPRCSHTAPRRRREEPYASLLVARLTRYARNLTPAAIRCRSGRHNRALRFAVRQPRRLPRFTPVERRAAALHTSPSPHRGTAASTRFLPASGLGYRHFLLRYTPPSLTTVSHVTGRLCLLPTLAAFSREERENVRGGEREKGWCGILTCGIHVGPTLRDKVSYISHSHPRSHFIVECHAIITTVCSVRRAAEHSSL